MIITIHKVTLPHDIAKDISNLLRIYMKQSLLMAHRLSLHDLTLI